MGFEVALILSAVSAVGELKNAKAQADATIKEGEIATKNKAKEVQAKAARVQSSFLTSGLTMEGTGNTSLTGVFDTGLEDINNLRSNYNTQAKNQINQGRTKALSSLATGFAGASMADFGLSNVGYGLDSWKNAGQTVGSWFDESPIGPYQSPWG